MSPKQLTQPLQTESKPPLQRPTSMRQSSTSVATRQPPMSVKAARDSYCSSPTGRNTNPGPSTKRAGQTAPRNAQNLVAKRSQQLICTANCTGNGTTLSLPEREPLDDEIKELLKLHRQPDGPNGYLHHLRLVMYTCARLALDPVTDVLSDRADSHVKQLVRVIDELKTTGQCRVGEEIIRP